MTNRTVVKSALADLSTGVVVMKVHERAGRLATSGAAFPRVDERLGEGAAVGDVVRTPGPLEAVGGARVLDRAVAAAAIQQPRAAGARDRVRNAGRRDSVHERRLAGTCMQRTTIHTRRSNVHGSRNKFGYYRGRIKKCVGPVPKKIIVGPIHRIKMRGQMKISN